MLHAKKSAVGHALEPARAGDAKIAFNNRQLAATERIDVSSPAFNDGAAIPKRFTDDGDDVSPPLRWGAVPDGTRALVLLCEDPDAPLPKPFVHWIVANLTPEIHELPEDFHDALQGQNSMMKDGYAGPAPPRGHGTHRYHFELFALDGPLDVGDHPGRGNLLDAMAGHVLASGDLVGTYAR